MKSPSRFLLPVFAVLITFIAAAAVGQTLYRWVDKDGKVHYTDMPPPDDAKNVQEKKLTANLTQGGTEEMPYATRVAVERFPVILYAADCKQPCELARAFLAKRGIPYTEKNPSLDGDAAAALKGMVGGLYIPTLVVGANPIKGFDEALWNTTLDGAGYPANNPFLRQAPPVKKAPAPTDGNGAPAAAPAAADANAKPAS